MHRGPLSSLLALVPLPVSFLVIAQLLMASVTAQGQTYIFGRADIPVGVAPTAVAAGDFDGDRLTDLAVANNGDATVSVLLQRSDGSFAPQVTYATGGQPVAIAAGDFNGDGNLDIAVTNENCTALRSGVQCTPSTVSVLLGNGDGTFQPHRDYSVGQLPSSLLAADFNGDGKLDLAVTNAVDSTVSILLGNGDGTFQPQVVYATASAIRWQSVVAGDFNADGKLDLAVSCGSVVSVLLGNGDGTFKAHLDSATGGASLAVGDFNHDGKLDLVVTGPGVGVMLSVLLGNGDGTFTLYAQYLGGSAVTTSDLRGNGMLDLIVSEAGGAYGDTNNSVAILLGKGDGTFQGAVNYGTGNSPFGLIVVDVNGDGKPDLAVADSECVFAVFPCAAQIFLPGTISVLLGFGDGTFVGKSDYGVGNGPLAVTTADFNKDSHLDLATPNQSADSASVLLGNGDGTFKQQVSYSVGHLPVSVMAADFRNNGDLDLVTANETCTTPTCNPGTVSVLLGNVDGTFQTHVDYGVGLLPFYAAVGDFRGNRKLDLAVANNASASVSILLGNGDGTFQPQVSYLTAPNPVQIATGDFNQDGKLDLALAAGGGASILLGNGDGTFKSHTDYPGGGSAIATGDFNGDGKLDFATGGTHQVSVFLGNGDGTFQPPINYQTDGMTVFSIAVTDFNNDGKLDLAVNTESTEFFILLGNGDGTFQQPIGYLLANEISESLTTGDFNGDGVPDWAAGDANTNTLGVMLSSSFKAVSPSSLIFGARGIGTTSQPQSITISNPTNVKIEISSIMSTGNFGQTNDCGAKLAVGANCSVNVTFSPSLAGPQSGSIIVTDSTRISPLAIPLTGNGVNGSFLTPYPSRLPFPAGPVGTSSSQKIVTLVNSGNASLSISAINVTGLDSSDFAEINNCPSSLSAGASCNANVTFTVEAGGTRMANLAITDTAPGSPQLVSLVGRGLAPATDISQNQLIFASQTVGTTSTAQTLSLTNSGNASLTITQIAASGDFAETNTCNTPIAAGSNCQIAITFTPTKTGNRSGAVTISDNAAGSPQTISLSGLGAAAPDFSISPAPGSPTSENVGAGETASFDLSLAGSGTFSGTINLSCVVTPTVTQGPLCSLSSSSEQINGTVAQSVTVKVGTTAPSAATMLSPMGLRPGLLPLRWTLLCTTMFIGLSWLALRGRKRTPVLAAPVLFLTMLTWVACGVSGSSSSHNTGTTPGTYTATIKATSGSLSHTVSLQVIVQ